MKRDPYIQLEPGKSYHIYNRGNNKENLFKEPSNYFYFLSLWVKYIEPVAKTYCYNLLPNHFHFFIRIDDSNSELSSCKVSQAFSNYFNAYAKAINYKYDRTGSLFQERFRRVEVDSDEYFTKIIGYILTNAVKHGYCKNVAAYPYSAYNILISDKPTRLLRKEILDWFGNKENLKNYILNYRQDINDLGSMLQNEIDDDD